MRQPTSLAILHGLLVLIISSKFEYGKEATKAMTRGVWLLGSMNKMRGRKEEAATIGCWLENPPLVVDFSNSEQEEGEGRGEESRENDWRGKKSEECKQPRRKFAGHISQLCMYLVP